jgi:hypothetical protein
MRCKKIVLCLPLAITVVSAAPVFYFSEGRESPGNFHTSSSAHFPLEQIIRLFGKSPVFGETLCNVGQGATIPQEASLPFQALPFYGMLLCLGALEQQPDKSLKALRPLRIDVIGYDFLLPANPTPLSSAFPNDPRYDTFALAPWNAHLYPDSDIAPSGTNALQRRSLPSPWILATRKNPHQLIIDASPWMLLAFTSERNTKRLVIVIGLHPAQETSSEDLNQLRSDENPNWEAIQKIYIPSLPAGASASSHPEIANRISILTHMFALQAHRDEWRLMQIPAQAPHDDDAQNILLSPGSRLSMSSKTLNHEALEAFKKVIAEINSRNFAEADRNKALSHLHVLWEAAFPGTPFYLRLKSHIPSPPAAPPPPPPPPATLSVPAYASRISALRPITLAERLAYAKEQSIAISDPKNQQEIRKAVPDSPELDIWVHKRRGTPVAPSAPPPEAAPLSHLDLIRNGQVQLRKVNPATPTNTVDTVIAAIRGRHPDLVGNREFQEQLGMLREFLTTYGYMLTEEHLKGLNSQDLKEILKFQRPPCRPGVQETERQFKQDTENASKTLIEQITQKLNKSGNLTLDDIRDKMASIREVQAEDSDDSEAESRSSSTEF